MYDVKICSPRHPSVARRPLLFVGFGAICHAFECSAARLEKIAPWLFVGPESSVLVESCSETKVAERRERGNVVEESQCWDLCEVV